MQALHPIFADIVSTWIPPQPAGVTVRQTRFTSPMEIEFRGIDREAVQQAAERRKNGLDSYRSPAVSMTRMEQGEWVTTLRFYAVD